jgi:hypothetical protein
MFRRLSFAAAVLFLLPACWGKTLLICQFDPYTPLYQYNASNWTGFTAALNTAFGGSSNITVTSSQLTNAAALANVDAILVDFRTMAATLAAGEVTNLQSFIASGRRIVLLGENSSWTVWDNSILGLVGGTFSGSDTSATLTPIVSNSLTAGVTSLATSGDGITAAGGTSLFNLNVVTLWGAGQNVVTMLSVNTVDDSAGSAAGNVQFKTNLATWLAGGPSSGGTTPTVPALSEWGLLLLAILIIGTAAAALAMRPSASRS